MFGGSGAAGILPVMGHSQIQTEVGAPRPDCPCHGVPMRKKGVTSGGQQRWGCAVIRAMQDAVSNPRRIMVAGLYICRV